jgi:hypothetical protein
MHISERKVHKPVNRGASRQVARRQGDAHGADAGRGVTCCLRDLQHTRNLSIKTYCTMMTCTFSVCIQVYEEMLAQCLAPIKKGPIKVLRRVRSCRTKC